MLTPYKVSTMKTMILSYLLIRMKMLQTPTSFSHRRLVLFLMSVSWDDPETHLMPKVYDTKLYDTKLKSQVIPDYIQIRYQESSVNESEVLLNSVERVNTKIMILMILDV
ncbi:unnamed protein product [Lactuca saligna]|uniref:Uncharacterized protein n=1 Tax=Lactuca saligna TaxID=75948 RepID=A0AA35YW15_LACSI|nr:unnamed protein product [Lactuca saligna]